MKELVKLTKQYLQEEYSTGDCVLADLETCNFFRDHFKKQTTAPQQIKTAPKPIAPPPPPKQPKPVEKVEKQPIKPVQSIEHSEFKKLLSDHFPGVSIIDPPSP